MAESAENISLQMKWWFVEKAIDSSSTPSCDTAVLSTKGKVGLKIAAVYISFIKHTEVRNWYM